MESDSIEPRGKLQSCWDILVLAICSRYKYRHKYHRSNPDLSIYDENANPVVKC